MRCRLTSRALFAAFLLVACNNTDPPSPPADTDPIEHELPYPEGPYGTSKGITVGNYEFSGYVNPAEDRSELQTILMAELYNPHGRDPSYVPASPDEDDRLFRKGSIFGEGKKKPLALALDVSAVWCGPCKELSKTILPPLAEKYFPCDGLFMLALLDGPTPGTPVEQKHLDSWVKTFDEDFPSVFDPKGQISPLFNADSFPSNLIIDTTTMKVVEVVIGLPPDSYWATFEQLLDAQSCGL